MMKRNLSLFSIFIALIGLGSYYVFASKPVGTGPIAMGAKTTSSITSKSDAAVNDFTMAQSGTTKVTAALGPSASMHDAFNKAQNYASFIAEALNRPEEGGRFYAFIAFNRCQEIMPFVFTKAQQKDKPQSSIQQAATQTIRDLQERCKGVATQYPDGVAFHRAVLDSRGERDPTFSLYNRLTDSHKVPEDVHRNDLNRALAGGDKYDTITALELGKDTFAKDLSTKYGKKLPESVVDSAFAAVACELTKTCTTSLWVLGACATAGDCEIMNRSEQLRAEFSGTELELFDRLKRDVSRMVNQS